MSDSPLMKSLAALFSLPNWENRCGEWKDINDALREVHRCFADRDLYYAKADFLRPLTAVEESEILKNKRGLAAIVGKWPGDETDEEIERALSEV